MTADDVTLWITDLAQGDARAAQRIWDRYCERLVELARKKLGERHRRAADEEDVAISAFASFCRGIRRGRFPNLRDRHELWNLLVTITARKATAQLRREHAKKRGGGKVRGESVFVAASPDGPSEPDDERGGLAAVVGGEPTPEFALEVAEECDRLLDSLEDDVLREVALRKLEGYTNEEIARQLDCVPGTVERKLARIRKKWAKQLER